MKPAISVLMSVYNTEKFLGEAIDSILNQTFTDFEFLIIDDGSTDCSLKILETYAKQDSRVRVTSRENRGIACTRNELLYQSQGELIAVMDADDVALPDRFSLQVEFLRHHPEVLAVGGAYDLVDSNGEFLSYNAFPGSDEEIQPSLLKGVTALHHPTALVRRAAILQVGGYNEAMTAAIDLDLWLRLGETGKLANLPDKVLKYRLHKNSISERRNRQQTADMKGACQRAWQRRGIEGKFEVSDAWRQPLMLRYGWNMFLQGNRKEAIRYGLRAVKLLPFDRESWRLLVCALIKPMHQGETP